jgi:hypothetical protein
MVLCGRLCFEIHRGEGYNILRGGGPDVSSFNIFLSIALTGNLHFGIFQEITCC